MHQFKKDEYRSIRGSYSRVLDVVCAHCDQHVTFYQKDGPGELKRMYADRFIEAAPEQDELACKMCGRILGIRYIYEKENRQAYRLFAGAVKKKVVKSSDVR